MGSRKRMAAWGQQRVDRAPRAALGIFLLGLTLAQSVNLQPSCSSAEAPLSLTQPQYQDTAEMNSGAGFMTAVVQSFLHTVQPKPFPEDLILRVYTHFQELQSNQELVREILLYEVGFLVCTAIGILYIVLMPIFGFFLACCRCCGNCGGKMYQKQTPSTHCRRRSLYWSAFVTTAIIFAGNICMFKSNEHLQVSVDESALELNNSIKNVHTFLTAVPQQVYYVVNESYRTIQEVTENLDAIGPQLGLEIQGRFRGTLDPALLSVKALDEETENTSEQLKQLDHSLSQLQASVDVLQSNLTAVKNNINQTLSKPECLGSSDLNSELHKLTIDTSITIPSLSEFQSAVNEVVHADLKSIIKEVNDHFSSIPQRVTNDTKDVVQTSKRVLDRIKTQISRVTDDVPLAELNDVLDSVNRVEAEITKVTPDLERAEHIRWGVCVALCCVVLLVVVCNLLGLVMGPLGLKHTADPTKRSWTADCGGTFFMMAAGFIFVFSWLFMIAVVLLFLLGGNTYTLVCQPWKSGQLLKVIDTPGLIPGLDIGASLGIENVTISSIYSDCTRNQPLWVVLHLDKIINLEELLNVSKYTEEIQQHFESTDITLSSVTLLSPEQKNLFRSFSSKAGNVDLTAATQQMNNISSINLNTTADKLDGLAAIQTNADIQKELQDAATDLRNIQTNIETTIFPQLEKLNSTMGNLRPTAGRVNGTVGEVLRNVEAAQDFLDTNTSQIIKNESRHFIDCQLIYFTDYADWAKLTITKQVGRCGPVAGAVDSAAMILCSHMVESLNAFWFSLGWCMIFFIPSIIFSIKLAKYYRRMKYSDVYDNPIIVNHIPRAHMIAN
ncbi:prominin-2 [Aulostomus maculatus]